MYLLDTNIVSYWMRGDLDLIERIRSHAPRDLALSTITLAEIWYGIEKSPHKKRERQRKIQQINAELRVYPFDEVAARKYAVNRAELERNGTVISERDTQIASIAKAHGLVVVTHNTREFGRVSGLRVEDWAS